MAEALIHRPGEGEANGAFGFPRWLRVPPEATGDALAVFEEEIPAGHGPPRHIHRTEHEIFAVLEGRVLFECSGRQVEAGPGTTVAIPPGAVHAFKGLGPGPARVLNTLTPGRGYGFFRQVEAEGLAAPADMDRIRVLAEDYHIEFVGPPLD